MKPKKLLAFLSIMVVVFVIATTTFIVLSLNKLSKDQDRVSHAQNVQREIQEILSASYQIENSIRVDDYQNTKLAFQAGKSDYERSIKALGILVADNERQFQNQQMLRNVLDNRLRDILEFKNANLDSLSKRNKTFQLIEYGQLALRDVRRICKIMYNEEEDLFVMRTQVFNASIRKSFIIIILFIIIISSILVWSYNIIKREYSRNAKYNEQQKLAYDSLFESEQKFKILNDSISDVVLKVNDEMEILSWNAAGGKILGYSELTMIGSDFQKLIDNDTKESLKELLTDKNEIKDVFILQANGEKIPMELVSFDWNVGENKYTGISLRDNHVRYEQTKLIQDLGSRFDLVLKSAHYGVWDWTDMSKEQQWWSQTMYDLIEYTPEEIPATHENFKKLVSKKDVNGLFEKLETIGNLPFTFEYRILTKNSGEKWFRANGEVIENKLQGSQRMMGVINDISEEKNQTLKLEEFNKRFTLTTESAEIGTWDWYNIEEQEMWFSGITMQLLGFEKEERVFNINEFVALIHKDDLPDMMQAVGLNHTTGEIYKAEYRILTEDRGYVWVRAIGDSVIEKSTGHKRMIGVLYSIEDEIKQRRAIEESNKQLEQFAYVASHDLREPLRKIKAFGERLQTQFKKEDFSKEKIEQAEEYITRMRSGASRMETLIDDLLSFSRVSSSQSARSDTSLQETAQNVVNELDLLIQKTNSEIIFEALPTIKDAIPSQFFQLFQNLISNSIKFASPDKNPIIEISGEMEKGSELLEIYPNIEVEEQYYVLSIKDNGIGFEDQYKDQIFTIFQRLHNRSEFEGTGIGLAICKKIVENHQGFISAISIVGEGTTFKIAFPSKTISLIEIKNYNNE